MKTPVRFSVDLTGLTVPRAAAGQDRGGELGAAGRVGARGGVVSVRRRENGKYEVRWRQGGRRYSRTFDRRRDADRFDVELRRRLQLGAVGMPEQEITLSEFVEEWWRVHVIANLATATHESYRRTWAKHLLPRLGGYRV